DALWNVNVETDVVVPTQEVFGHAARPLVRRGEEQTGDFQAPSEHARSVESRGVLAHCGSGSNVQRPDGVQRLVEHADRFSDGYGGWVYCPHSAVDVWTARRELGDGEVGRRGRRR